MPDPITDIADPEIQGELDGLRLLVEETEGNVIAFVRYERVTEREAGVRYLKEQLSIPVVERLLSEERKNPLVLLDDLPDERCCVQLYDLEEALPEVTGYLNVNREAYADVPHALVFWVGEHGLREIAENAPDFWAWRSGVFDVRSESADLSQSLSEVAITEAVRFTNRGDLERRAELYKGLIQEYKSEGEKYVAQLRLKLAGVLFLLRELEKSKEEAFRTKEYAEAHDEEKLAASAYYRLGTIAMDHEELDKAERWYRKAMEVRECLGDESGLETLYSELGRVARGREEFDEAEEWFRKSLRISRRLEDDKSIATTYHQLGLLAQSRKNYDKAKEWYRKSLKLKEQLGDEHRAAQTHYNLGRIAQEQRRLDEAEDRYQKALKIFERLDDERLAGRTYHQLGMIAQEREDYEEAERRYRQAAEIKKRLENELDLARSYQGLGIVARKRHRFDEAEKWYQKSIEIFEQHGYEQGAAISYNQLGHLEEERGNLQEAGEWFFAAALGYLLSDREQKSAKAFLNFVRIFDAASPDVRVELRKQLSNAGFSAEQLDELLEQARAEESN